MYGWRVPDTSLVAPYLIFTFLLGIIGLLVVLRGYGRFKGSRKSPKGFPGRKKGMLGGVILMCIGCAILGAGYLELQVLMTMWHPVLTLGPKPVGVPEPESMPVPQ